MFRLDPKRLPELLKGRENLVLAALFALAGLLFIVLLGRLLALRGFYLSPSYRRDGVAILGHLRDDTGWGLSNFTVDKGGCKKERCEMLLKFAYHAPAKIKPPRSEFRLTWTRGQPETYAIHVD